MRRFIVIAAAVAIAVIGYAFIEGKPEANACRGSGGPIGSDTGSPGPSNPPQPGIAFSRVGGIKNGKDGAFDGD